MYRLSLVISEIYNKYLPLAEKGNIRLNLDFSDTTKTVDEPEAVKADLEKHLSSALSRSDRGEISISVEQDAIVVTDSGTILSKPICALLSKGRVSVTSRVGFGTTARISLLPPPPEEKPLPAPAAKSSVSTKTPPKSLPSSQPTKHPKPAKPTREQRKLITAAKKADRKIQKLRKSQRKQAAKTKPVKKTRKKVLEFS